MSCRTLVLQQVVSLKPLIQGNRKPSDLARKMPTRNQIPLESQIKTAMKIYKTDLWTLWGKERGGRIEQVALTICTFLRVYVCKT